MSGGGLSAYIFKKRISIMILPSTQTEGSCHEVFVRGEIGVPLRVPIEEGKKDLIGPIEKLCVNLSASDDEDSLLRGQGVQGRFGGRITLDIGNGMGGENNISPIGKGAPKRYERLSPHYNRVTGGQPLEALEVFGNMPGKGPLVANHPVSRKGSDDGQPHTATSNLMAECGSYPTRLKSSNANWSIGFLIISSRGLGFGVLVSCSFKPSIWFIYICASTIV